MARPRTPLLGRERIRAAALALVDADGLEALSMRRLAQRLDVQAASLYTHYRTKDDLLADLANTIMDGVDVSGFSGSDWRIGLAAWARSYRAALAAHPNLVPVVAVGPGRRDAALRRADAVHGALVGAGWPPRQATMIGAAAKYLVVGAALSSFARGFSDDAQVYADRYPNLPDAHRLAGHAAAIDTDSFELALDALIAGLEPLTAEE
ncbi:TetR/AcrR family transcriptional regulator C-terminal domain-containing protein [Nocardiopsis coralliicola]